MEENVPPRATPARWVRGGFSKFLWIVCFIGALLGGLAFLLGSGVIAPAAVAAAVIPYCLARAWDELQA